MNIRQLPSIKVGEKETVIGSKLDQEIISIYNRDISALQSINQIAHKLNKSYPNINHKVNSFIKKDILNKKEVGRSYLCSINLKSDKAVLLLSLNEVKKKDKVKKKFGKDFLEDIKSIKSKFDVHTVLLKKNSLFFVLGHIFDKEAIKKLYPSLKKFNLVFFTKQEFQSFVCDEKDILDGTTVLCCYESYYSMLSEIYSQLLAGRLSR